MAKTLVIVESPAKARTIGRYLGKGYVVKASNGHVVDLPEKELGVSIEDGFRPKYVVIPGKQKVLKELKAAGEKASTVYLACDPDREGEAIAWFVMQKIGLPEERYRRVLFYEITPQAISGAMTEPQAIDMKKVNAQQARRILDRLVGYKVSPILWKTIRPGLSAGRVQTVALRLICEREEEIARFVPREYWEIAARLSTAEGAEFLAKLVRIEGEKPAIGMEEEAHRLCAEVDGGPFSVGTIERKERKRNPAPPFTTSTLQQEAARRLGFSAAKTMALAQALYEGLEVGKEGSVGLITYMRTDSTRLAESAVAEARQFITATYGEQFVPRRPATYRPRGRVQGAHEAIRPTSVARTPESIEPFLTRDQHGLYQLIWLRFLACQMAPAVYDTTTVDIPVGRFLFRATGSILKFGGFLAVYEEAREEQPAEEQGEGLLPQLREGEELALRELLPSQHFTQPPPRYSEATLVRELESKGIGRPSTYAAITSTIRERGYVTLRDRKFHPTELGKAVNAMLVRGFPAIFNISFTREMETELDKIESGELPWQRVLEDFYGPFAEALAHGKRRGHQALLEHARAEGEVCEKCGRTMVVKWNKAGPFLACPGYPECRNTRPLERDEAPLPEVKGDCPLCGAPLEIKRGRYGPFLACSRYPDCRHTQALEANRSEPILTEEKCPKCGGDMVVKEGRFGRFLACSNYPTCKSTRPLTLGIPCPREGCTGDLAERRTRRGKTFFSCSRYPACDYASWDRPVARECPKCAHGYAAERETKRSGLAYRCLKCGERFRAEVVTAVG